MSDMFGAYYPKVEGDRPCIICDRPLKESEDRRCSVCEEALKDGERQAVIDQLKEKGYEAKPCVDPDMIALKVGEAEDPNERMRLTADGQFYIVDDGYYYQIGSVEDLKKFLEAKP